MTTNPLVIVSARRRTFADALTALYMVADDDHADVERRVDSRYAAQELFEALRQAEVRAIAEQIGINQGDNHGPH